MKWFVLGWVSAGVVSGVALARASRHRRDRHRPTGGFFAMFDGLGSLGEILSRETYDADKPRVALILRNSLLVAMALFVAGVALSLSHS